ncbi:uncharacterized protein [Chironomus tepperi]|uniref:uncharacterized protein n=1 Tax=Chironomus tepperi TaxID=113505 RepID=UPI00391F5C7E
MEVFCNKIWILLVLNILNFTKAFEYQVDSAGNALGGKCILKDNRPGVCKYMSSCDYVKQLYQSRKTSDIVRCQFIGKNPVVCCPTANKFRQAICTNKTIPLKIQDNIIRGYRAEVGEFPFQAALGFASTTDDSIEFRCGGSLIADDIILTAAHCVSRIDDMPVLVRLGRTSIDLDDTEDDTPVQDIEVQTVKMHPQHSKRSGHYDIALIKLKHPATLSDFVQTICISSNDNDLPRNFIITGFGRVDPTTSETSNWLLKGTINLFPYDTCRKTFASYNKTIMNNQLCAQSTSGAGSCHGDSGGPMSYEQDGLRYVYGIISFGIGCGSSYPLVYTKFIKMFRCKVVILLTVLTLISAFTYDRESTDLYSGDKCVLNSGQSGICEEIKNCDYAQQLFQSKRTSEIKVCRFIGSRPIVCCPGTQKPSNSIPTIKKSSKKFQNSLCRNIKPSLKIDNHIINGKKAGVGEFPFQAVLGYRNGNAFDFRCGGSLIADNIVLTAAHCVSRTDDMPIIVRLGKTSIDLQDSEDDTTAQDIGIETIKIHPQHSKRSGHYDIALIKLRRPATLTNFVQTICLSSDDNNLPRNFVITGFGRVDPKTSETSNWLLKGNVALYPYDTCRKTFAEHKKTIIDSQICAFSNSGTGNCHGDSGGPMSYEQDGLRYLYGIISFGIGCGSNYPLVYTKVNKFLDWIDTEMLNLDEFLKYEDEIPIEDFQLEQDEKCVLKNNQQGICKEFSRCDFARQLYESKKSSEITKCKRIGNRPFVCCPSDFKSDSELQTVRNSNSKFKNALCENVKPVLQIEDHITNGMKAVVGEFPFHVALGYTSKNGKEWEFHCGGSLIADDIVLTAAHCLNRKELKPKIVRIGRTSINLNDEDDDTKAQDIEIETVRIHKQYTRKLRLNDIALIKLKKPAVLSTFVKTICLSTKDDNLPNEFTITGFGRTDEDTLQKSDWLLKGNVNEYPLDKCKEKLFSTAEFSVADSQFCAISAKGIDVCRGDSGGPLVYKQNDIFYLQAITSFGTSCVTNLKSKLLFNKMFSKIVSIVILISASAVPFSEASLFSRVNIDLGLGANCILKNYEQGYCEKTENCQQLSTMHNSSEISYCGFDGSQRLVCCPQIPQRSNQVIRPSKFRKLLCNNDQIVHSNYKQGRTIVNAEIGEFPFQAAIGYKSDDDKDYDFYCGGSLIADDIVLTAANCVNRMHRVPVMVRLGRTSLDLSNVNDNSEAQDIEIETIKIHPKYTRKSHHNDIALIKLKTPYMPSDSIMPICLSTNEANLPKEFLITGFGKVNQYAKKRSNWLLKGKISEYPINKCKDRLLTTVGVKIVDSQFCGVSNTGVDICRGEPGSSVIYKQNNVYRLQAITSFGAITSCGTTYPAIYTRVSKFLGWIEDTVNSI